METSKVVSVNAWETSDGLLWGSAADADAHQYNVDNPQSIQPKPTGGYIKITDDPALIAAAPEIAAALAELLARCEGWVEIDGFCGLDEDMDRAKKVLRSLGMEP